MPNYLVIGGTGKTGRRVVHQLTAAGHTVRAGTRHPAEPSGAVTPVRFDWDDPSTFEPALAGAQAVYVIPPALRFDHPPLIAALLAQAKAVGVERAVFLSARGADLDPAGALALAEAEVRTSGLPFTIVRPSWFMQNLTEAFFRPTIDGQDAIIFPAGDGAEPYIDAEDIAAVVVAALTDARHAGESYDLSGPANLTMAQIAGALSAHLGRAITYIDAEPQAWEQATVEAGVPADYAALLGFLAGLIRDGHEAHLSDGVQRALGREPRPFAEWLLREADQLRTPVAAA